jgi:hypothetical protein
MKAQHMFRVLGGALTLALVVGGCGGGGSGSSNRVSVSGQAFYPDGSTVSGAPFTIIDPERPNDPLTSATSTNDGGYFGVIRKTRSVAVILQGAVGPAPVRVAGLILADSNSFAKDLDGQTDIACEAGVTAVIDGSISGDDLGPNRIANLENAAARFVAGVDFTNPAAVTAAANQVRTLTNDGAHPAN